MGGGRADHRREGCGVKGAAVISSCVSGRHWSRDGRAPPKGARTVKGGGLSIRLVEQNASLALKLVDYVHVMSKGQAVYSARPDGLVEQRQSEIGRSGYLT
jgi:hypothetical protein